LVHLTIPSLLVADVVYAARSDCTHPVVFHRRA
jgi:hypothetical protein